MKAARSIFKLVAVGMAVAAAVCCVIAYWDKIYDGFYALRGALCSKLSRDSEYDDYADWDD